jgi:hypothetical protein
MTSCTEFINYNDKLYVVYRKFKEGRIREEYLNQVREMYDCDLVLKSKTEDRVTVLFLREVKEAELVN